MAEEELSCSAVCKHSEPDSRASEINEENEGDSCMNVESNSYDSSDGNVLKCDHCCFETGSQSILDNHSEGCQGDGRRKPYECDVCMIKFSNGANMRRHKMRHSGFKPFQCRTCHKRFFRKDHLSEHLTTHVKPLPFHCPVCNRGFQRHIAMRAHFQNEHLMKRDSVKSCPLCSYQATSAKNLQLHFASSHGIDLDRPSGPDSEIPFESNGPPMHFLAPHVEISTDEPAVNHSAPQDQTGWREAKEESCVSSAPPSVKQEATPSVDSSQSSPAKGYCLKSLLSEEPLWWRDAGNGSEGKTTSRLGPLACPHCSITFPDPTLYFLHKGCHSDADPWRCNICGQQTQNVYDFNSHLLSKPHN